MLIGVLSGYAALLLRFSIEWISSFWTGSKTWEAALHTLPWYIYLLAPTIAGLIIGWALMRILPHGEMRGVAGVLADLVERNARINPMQMVTETLGAALSMGSGASLGREDPTMALGAVISSEIGHRLGLSEQQLRTLIGCGVAAGISASFNTPIAGTLFALEVILADYTIATFSPIVIASVVATVITRAEIGNFPAFLIPEYHLISISEIPFYMVIGGFCGLLAAVLIKAMAPMRNFMEQMLPDCRMRLAAAGLALGLMGLVLPEIMSIGYDTLESIVLEHVHPEILGMAIPLSAFLGILLVGKLLATIISAASGFPGGLLGPTLFLGAVIGALLGGFSHDFMPAYSESYGAYALVACGAMAAASLQAPITIIIMVFELSGDYEIMLPLMSACIVATMVKRAFGRSSVFTEPLDEMGVETGWHRERAWMCSIKVDQIPWKTIPRLHESASLKELKSIFVSSGRGSVQIVDDDGLMVGIVTFSDLQPWLLDPSLDQIAIASEVANRNVRSIPENGNLFEAIRIFDKEIFEQMPVMSRKNSRKVLGILSRNAVFSTYHRLIVEHGEKVRPQ